MRQNFFLVLIIGALFFAGAFAARAAGTLNNAGFARGGILFSKDPFFAGDKVRIYTILWNGSAEDLSGIVEFYDNGKALGGADFTAKGGGTVRDVWLDWTATFGDHSITAKIADAKSSLPGGTPQAVTFDTLETGATRIFVDNDVNKNGVGDRADPELQLQLQKLAAAKTAAHESASTPAATNTDLEMVKNLVGTTTANTVLRVARDAAQMLEAARTAGEKWATAKSAALKAELGVSGDPMKIKTVGKSSEVSDRPFKYAYQLFTAVLGFVLASKWLTYAALALALYFLLKVLYRWLLR